MNRKLSIIFSLSSMFICLFCYGIKSISIENESISTRIYSYSLHYLLKLTERSLNGCTSIPNGSLHFLRSESFSGMLLKVQHRILQKSKLYGFPQTKNIYIARLQSTPSWLIFVATKNLYSSFFVVLCQKS